MLGAEGRPVEETPVPLAHEPQASKETTVPEEQPVGETSADAYGTAVKGCSVHRISCPYEECTSDLCHHLEDNSVAQVCHIDDTLAIPEPDKFVACGRCGYQSLSTRILCARCGHQLAEGMCDEEVVHRISCPPGQYTPDTCHHLDDNGVAPVCHIDDTLAIPEPDKFVACRRCGYQSLSTRIRCVHCGHQLAEGTPRCRGVVPALMRRRIFGRVLCPWVCVPY